MVKKKISKLAINEPELEKLYKETLDKLAD